MAAAETGDTSAELEPPPASLTPPVWKYYLVSYDDNVHVVDKKTTVCEICYVRVALRVHRQHDKHGRTSLQAS